MKKGETEAEMGGRAREVFFEEIKVRSEKKRGVRETLWLKLPV